MILNMSIYICLIAFAAFVIWQIRTNPIEQIHNAVSDGNLEQVKIYLEQGVDVDSLKNGWETPLFIAVSKNHEEIVELLISH